MNRLNLDIMKSQDKIKIYKDINPIDASKIIDEQGNDDDPIILDVRTPWEYSTIILLMH